MDPTCKASENFKTLIETFIVTSYFGYRTLHIIFEACPCELATAKSTSTVKKKSMNIYTKFSKR